MKKIFSTVIVLCFVACLHAQVAVTIDPLSKKQTITGLGTCTTSSLINDHLYDMGSSMIRLSILGTPGLEDVHNDNADPNNLDLSAFTWPQSFIDIAKAAQQTKTKVIVNAFSPPAWMKSNGDVNNGGYLIDSLYEEFGEWALGCVKAFRQQAGFDMYAFGPQNEPEFPEPYPSCIYTPQQLMKASKWIGRKFDSAGINVKIFHGEILFAQSHALQFFQAVNNDSICKKYVDAFAIHISDNDGLNVTGTGMASTWYKLCYNECLREEPRKEFWLTEDSDMDGYKQNGVPLMDACLLEACQFYNGMYYGNLSTWLYCADNSRQAQQVYYLYKQLFRFIRPHAVRVFSSANDPDIYTLAFVNDSVKATTIVLINKGNTEKNVTVNLPSSPGVFDIFRTSATEYCEHVGKTDLSRVVLPARSISSLVHVEGNRLPTIDNIDTIVVLKNSSGTIPLTDISDGGEGNQTVTLSVFSTMPTYFTTLSVQYTSPDSSATLTYTCAYNITGEALLGITIDDHSPVMDGFYSQKTMFVKFIIIPYINKAPTFDSIPDQYFSQETFNTEKTLLLTGVSDGNGGIQKLSLSAISSNPDILNVTTTGTSMLKLTPRKDGTVTITVTLKDDGNTYLGGKNSLTRTFKVVCGTGNAMSREDESLSVFPDPVSDVLYLRGNEEIVSCEIYDLQGKGYGKKIVGQREFSIEMQDLPAGIYFVHITTRHSSRVFKIVKE